MTSNKRTGTGPRGRFSKSDWLAAALDALADGGIEAVRVERLAKQLGVAKSGFYFHFRDRDDLHQALLNYWLSLDNAPIERERAEARVPVEERLLIISDVIERTGLSRYDMAIRLWARQSEQVRRVWLEEMDRRIQFVRKLFAELGFAGDDLEARVRLFAAYNITGAQVFGAATGDDDQQLRKALIRVLTTPA